MITTRFFQVALVGKGLGSEEIVITLNVMDDITEDEEEVAALSDDDICHDYIQLCSVFVFSNHKSINNSPSSFTQLEYDEDDEGDTNLNAQSVPDIRGEDEPPLDDGVESEPVFEISVVIRKDEVSICMYVFFFPFLY